MIASLARPGGNVTGTATNAPELAGKMVGVVRDLLPRMTRIAFINEPDYPGMSLYQRSAERAAAAYGISAHTLAVRAPPTSTSPSGRSNAGGPMRSSWR